jgi:hypothetical protein
MDWINGAHSTGFSVEVADQVLGVATEDSDEVSDILTPCTWSLSGVLFSQGFSSVVTKGFQFLASR